MLTLFRWLLRLTIGLILGAVLVVGLVWYFAVRSLPDYDATLRLSGLNSPVEIIRNTENVPHILAENDEDAFFALGLAHAQDRLFQMVMMRRAAQGRLAEVYGPRAYQSDDLARRLGFARMGRAALAAQDAPTRAALGAYAKGVNAWIAEVNRGALGRGAPEFFLLPGDISYWEPGDSIAILKLLAATSSQQISAEVLRARLSLADPAHGPEIMARLNAPELPEYAALFPGAKLIPSERSSPATDWDNRLAGFLAPGLGFGGHLAAADGQHTAAGLPVLANDAQLALTAPSLFYLARLRLSGGDVIGATIPGMPVVWSGRSDRLAWGIAPLQVDDADLFIEEVEPGASGHYRSATGWIPFDSRKEIIRVRDAPDRAITLRWSENGPILPGAHFNLAAVTPIGHVPALAWTGLSESDTTMSALIGMMRASDRPAMAKAAAQIIAPALSIVLADRDGITALNAGRLPRRGTGSASAGRLPEPGWQPQRRWTGTRQIPAAEPAQPAVIAMVGRDPAEGLNPAPDAAALRQGRLGHLLQSRDIHTRNSLIEAQIDIVSPAARTLLPLVGADLWFTGDPAAPGTAERQRQDALALLAEWDGAMNQHLPEPLIYAAWMAALQERLIRDELGPLADEIRSLRPGFIERVYRNRGGAARWCDIRQSAPVESCTKIARQALDAAIVDLTARFGPDVTSWRWGDVHPAAQPHPGLGAMRVIGWLVNLVQPISGGDITLATATPAREGAASWRAVRGAGYRAVYDLADPDSSVFVTATGQSGHPLSRHYDDLAERWRRGEYVSMALDPDLARAASVGITRLIPAP